MADDRNLDFIAMMGSLIFEEENERVRNLEKERQEAERQAELRRREEARAAAEAERRKREEEWAKFEVERREAERQQQQLRFQRFQREIQLQRTRESSTRSVVEMCRTCKNNTARFRNCPPEMVYCEAEDDVIRKDIAWCAYLVNEEGFTIPGLRIRGVM